MRKIVGWRIMVKINFFTLTKIEFVKLQLLFFWFLLVSYALIGLSWWVFVDLSRLRNLLMIAEVNVDNYPQNCTFLNFLLNDFTIFYFFLFCTYWVCSTRYFRILNFVHNKIFDCPYPARHFRKTFLKSKNTLWTFF